jgi:hypothetical protein|nr:MAG TPA: hypothetical protein [Caudoviricetes sp.]
MIIFHTPVKSMPIPGVSLRMLDLSFLSGYLGFDVTDKQEKALAKGLGYRRWVDALDLANALGEGISYIDETNIKPFSVDERYKKQELILSALYEIVDKTKQDHTVSVVQEMLAERWIEGAVMGASLIVDFTPEELANEAVKHARRRRPEK